MNNRKNGLSATSNANTMMEQQRSAMANSRRYVNGASHLNSLGIATNYDDAAQLLKRDTGSSSTEKSSSSKHEKYSSDLVVVLDMDECLIHSQFLSDQHVDKYRQVEDRPSSNSSSSAFQQRGNNTEEAESIVLTSCDSFRINLPDGDLVNVNKRPNLDLFLKEITSKFETYIFTAAMEVYAAPVLNRLDPNGDMFRGRFYRDSCVFHPELGVFGKDLNNVLQTRKKMMLNDNATAIDECDLPCDERRVVLVDNNPLSFLPNPSNGILVSSFYDDPKDDTLEAVMELLHELDESEDVRPILDSRFGLKDALEDVVKGAPVGW